MLLSTLKFNKVMCEIFIRQMFHKLKFFTLAIFNNIELSIILEKASRKDCFIYSMARYMYIFYRILSYGIDYFIDCSKEYCEHYICNE